MSHQIVRWHISLIALLMFFSGCEVNKTAEMLPSKGIPKNAIPISDGLYMAPIGKDGSGCVMYRPYSKTSSVVAAIFYRTAQGRFVLDKGKSACK
jgi:hypothetical protein